MTIIISDSLKRRAEEAAKILKDSSEEVVEISETDGNFLLTRDRKERCIGEINYSGSVFYLIQK